MTTDATDRDHHHQLLVAAARALGMRPGDRLDDIPAVAAERHTAAKNLDQQLSRALAEVDLLRGELADARADAVAALPPSSGSRPARAQDVEGNVDALLANVTRSLASARDDSERVEAVEMLLSGWYAAWPESAVTDPHAPLAAELVRLLGEQQAARYGEALDLLTLIARSVVTAADAMHAWLHAEDPDMARQLWRGDYEAMAAAALDAVRAQEPTVPAQNAAQTTTTN